MSAIRRLLPLGVEKFEEYLKELRTDPRLGPPRHLLTDSATSEGTGAKLGLELRSFSTRFEIARHLVTIFEDTALRVRDRDRGLWSWLSLFYFDCVCPADANGRRLARDSARYLLEPTNFRTYYRHLLAGPFTIFRGNSDWPERAAALLCGEVHSPGELVEQIASRMELVGNRAFVETVTLLYYDRSSGRLKKGAGGSGAGSPRRLALVQQQFDLTFDFFSLSATEILRLLPREFDRFKPTGTHESLGASPDSNT